MGEQGIARLDASDVLAGFTRTQKVRVNVQATPKRRRARAEIDSIYEKSAHEGSTCAQETSVPRHKRHSRSTVQNVPPIVFGTPKIVTQHMVI